jgi:hypothetical protein
MSGTIKRCKKCGKIFGSFGTDYCAECAEELDNIFNLVQDYIFEHENASVVEISEALDVDGKIILSFIKEGSLALSEGNYALTCERCHKPIPSGRYCDECKSALNKILKGAVLEHKQPEKEKEKEEGKRKKARMHIRHDQ